MKSGPTCNPKSSGVSAIFNSQKPRMGTYPKKILRQAMQLRASPGLLSLLWLYTGQTPGERGKKRLKPAAATFSFIFIIAFSSPLFLPEFAWPEAIDISTTVDKTEASLEDSIALSVTISGVQNAPPPQLPPLPDFRIQPTGTSSSIKIVNGQMNVSITHTYRLTPKGAGTFVIGPAKLELAGIVYSSAPITVVIKKTLGNQGRRNALAFIEATVSNAKPYLYEQVTLTLRLFHRVEAKNLQIDLSYERFQKDELNQTREYSQVINGLNYRVYETSVILFPAQPGPAEISSATMDVDLLIPEQARSPMNGYNFFFNDPFFGTTARNEHKTLKSKPIPMEVLNLPEKGRPADFSGLVGRFEISAALGKKELEAGDTTTLTITVTGTGNIQFAYLPPPDVKGHFKVYTDQPHLEKAIVNRKISGRKTFKFALVPLQEGKQVIPPIVLSYFDPEKRQYRTVKTNPIPVTILPSEVPEPIKTVDSNSLEQGFQPGAIKIIGKDILPIHNVLEDFEDQRPDHTAIYWACFIFPILLFTGVFAYFRYQRRLREDVAYSRTRRAYKVAREKLERISSARPSKEFIQELSQILREYIGNKLNLQGTAFTAKEVEGKLKERRFAEGKVASTRDLFEKFEAHQYGQDQNVAPDQLLEESLEVLKTLETKS